MERKYPRRFVVVEGLKIAFSAVAGGAVDRFVLRPRTAPETAPVFNKDTLRDASGEIALVVNRGIVTTVSHQPAPTPPNQPVSAFTSQFAPEYTWYQNSFSRWENTGSPSLQLTQWKEDPQPMGISPDGQKKFSGTWYDFSRPDLVTPQTVNLHLNILAFHHDPNSQAGRDEQPNSLMISIKRTTANSWQYDWPDTEAANQVVVYKPALAFTSRNT